jgi:hypothetical protein
MLKIKTLALLIILSAVLSENFLSNKQQVTYSTGIDDFFSTKCFWIKDFSVYELWSLRTPPDRE